MKTNNPLVSIVAISYNHADWLKFSLDSIRTQTYSNIEVIIIDSNSSDDSYIKILEYIESNGLNEWKVFRQDKPTSICQNLNFALSLIKGEYYQVVSCDDIILPDKIKLQIDFLSSAEDDYGLIYGDYSHIDENGIRIADSTLVLKSKGFSNTKRPPSGMIFCQILGTWYIHTITCLIRTHAARQIGGYDENLTYEDTDFILRLSRSFKFAAMLDEVAFYRILPSSFFRSRSVDFYLSTCKLYLKHFDSESCSEKVKRLFNHYFNTLFIKDQEMALTFFNDINNDYFDRYVSIYIVMYKWSGNKYLSIKVKEILSKFLK